MISDRYKCIFVHIPKSAGTSVGTKLGIYSDESFRGMQDHRSIRHLTPLRSINILQTSPRVYAEVVYYRVRDSLMLGRSYPTGQQLESYYKFSFVRNSWARVFSWYRNVMNDKVHKRRYRIPEDADFEWFVNNRLGTLRSQLYYLIDHQGRLGVDFVGRYENLHNDFDIICNNIGIDDSSLPEKMRRSPESYADAYTDDMVERVRQHYSDDIAHFQFTFG